MEHSYWFQLMSAQRSYIVRVNWKEDDQDTLVPFLETILDSFQEGKISRTQAIARITEAFYQGGLSSRSITAYMQSVIQEHQSLH
jgi:hypothetical protein